MADLEVFTIGDICNLVQDTEGRVRRILKKLNIVPIVRINSVGKQYLYTRSQLEAVQEYYTSKEKPEVIIEQEHPLVTDKRFLKTKFFPDVRISDD